MNKIVPDLKIFLIVIFTSLAVFSLDLGHFLTLPKRIAFYVTNPISFGLFQTSKSLSKQFFFLFQARFAAQESKALKEQIGQLLSENARLRKNLAEAQALISQKEHLGPETYNLLPARPVGIGRYLKVDKGLIDGIKMGEAVIFNDNLVGKIVEVSEKASNIQLLTDPDSKVAGFSQGLGGKAKGIILGQFGTDIIMDKILHEEKISVGDLVYSEGIEGFLPRGLVLGRVTKILDNQNADFKQAKVQNIFDVGDLDLVFVILE